MEKRTEELICKVVDGIATEAEREELKMAASSDPEVDRELTDQQEAADALQFAGLREMQDETIEKFNTNLYNSLESGAGWILIVIGYLLMISFIIYELLTQPDIGTVYRIGFAAALIGFVLLFSRVLRLRIKLYQQDKYKDVIR
jgi:hypothetical protein